MARGGWVCVGGAGNKPPAWEKSVIIADVLKPRFLPKIRPTKFNYAIGMATNTASLPAIGPTTAIRMSRKFEALFDRREYVSRDTFELSCHWYTGAWLCMPRKAKAIALSLTDETRSILAVVARSRTAPAHHFERSAIILHLANRRSASETAGALGIHRRRVTRGARRVAVSGRPPDITEPARVWLIGAACAKPKERGYPHELWTLRLSAVHGRSHGPIARHTRLAQLAPSMVRGILNSQAVKPHKVRSYLDRRDPAFDERKAEVIKVYAATRIARRAPSFRAGVQSAQRALTVRAAHLAV